MPVWHEKSRKLREEGLLQVAGIIQEQHPDRCRLFQQWKGLDWPVLVDPLNLLGVRAVPLVYLVDEHGVICKVKPDSDALDELVRREYPAPASLPAPAAGPDLEALRGSAALEDRLALADALFLSGRSEALDESIELYRRAIAESERADLRFRLGVALRRRFETEKSRDGDFSEALERWGEALAREPSQYIWRRRIQQYGPRLEKPYAFYDWVNAAREEILARGGTPASLRVEPSGAEIARPERRFAPLEGDRKEADPEGKLPRDSKSLIRTAVATAPARVRPGASARVHVLFRPDASRKAHWNNEAGELVLWLRPPPAVEVDRRWHAAPNAEAETSSERREIDFEVKLAPGAKAAGGAAERIEIPAYATYPVCEDVDGRCMYLRQDFTIVLHLEAGD